ncbi:unnamed protein product [Hymenolepis diminuta]|uniref:Glucuronosyltransferase n=1 Tax=Hymenolepis diminuta TaxID=6216 RepID=A0A0R3SGF4_HYMDI|nr:unnamed protein product [Hymenolepis diminuta]
MNKRTLTAFFGLIFILLVFLILSNQFALDSVLFPDPLSIASKVRDQDELRVAEANFQIGMWKLSKKLPLNINDMLDYNGNYNFLIIIITSNRGYRKIDAYEPYYLTQTSIALVKTLMSKNESDFKNVAKIRILVCAISHTNDTNHDVHNVELNRLRGIFGSNILISPPQHPDDSCKHTRDMSSCISLGMKRFPESDAVAVLEDDFLVTKHFHSALDLPEIPTIFSAQDLKSSVLGAATILPREVARKVGEVENEMPCHSAKGEHIAKIASELGYNTLNVRPPAVIHIGMYSQTRNQIYDPNLFPH